MWPANADVFPGLTGSTESMRAGNTSAFAGYVYCGTLIWNPGDIQLEPLFTIRTSKQKSGFAHFRSQNYQILLLLVIFNFSFWVYGPLKE